MNADVHMLCDPPHAEPYKPGDVIGCHISLKDMQNEEDLKDLDEKQLLFRYVVRKRAFMHISFTHGFSHV